MMSRLEILCAGAAVGLLVGCNAVLGLHEPGAQPDGEGGDATSVGGASDGGMNVAGGFGGQGATSTSVGGDGGMAAGGGGMGGGGMGGGMGGGGMGGGGMGGGGMGGSVGSCIDTGGMGGGTVGDGSTTQCRVLFRDLFERPDDGNLSGDFVNTPPEATWSKMSSAITVDDMRIESGAVYAVAQGPAGADFVARQLEQITSLDRLRLRMKFSAGPSGWSSTCQCGLGVNGTTDVNGGTSIGMTYYPNLSNGRLSLSATNYGETTNVGTLDDAKDYTLQLDVAPGGEATLVLSVDGYPDEAGSAEVARVEVSGAAIGDLASLGDRVRLSMQNEPGCGGESARVHEVFVERCDALTIAYDTFAKPNGDLDATDVDAPVGTSWTKPGGSGDLAIDTEWVTGTTDGTDGQYNFDQGVKLAFDDLRVRTAFELPTLVQPLSLLVNAESGATTMEGGLGMHIQPFDNGGTLFVDESDGVTTAVVASITGVSSSLSPATPYFMQLHFDHTGTQAALVLSSGSYITDGGTEIARVLASGFDAERTPDPYLQMIAGPAGSDPSPEIHELFVERGALATGDHTMSRRYGDSAFQRTTATAADVDGSVVFGVDFMGTVDFGAGNVSASGFTDGAIVKLDGEGDLLWQQHVAGTGAEGDYVRDLTLDANGNVLVLGQYTGSTVNLGGGNLSAGGGQRQLMIAKLGPDGGHAWSYGFGANGDQGDGGAIVAASDGDALFVSSYGDGLDLGGGALPVAGAHDIVVARFDADGTHTWSEGFGDGGDQRGEGIARDENDDVYVAGTMTGNVTISPLTAVSASGGGRDVLVAKLDGSNGDGLWAFTAGGTGDDWAWDAAHLPGCGVVVVGHFASSIDFGGGAVTTVDGDDIFIVALDADGTELWTLAFGGTGADRAIAVDTDAMGNIYVAGYLSSGLDFGGGALAHGGGEDLFVLKLDRAGNHLFSASYGDADNQRGEALAVGFLGHLVLGGVTNGTVDFGGGDLVGSGGDDAIVLGLAP